MADPDDGDCVIDWTRYGCWEIVADGNRFIAKVQDTAVQSYVVKGINDANLTFEVYGTPNNKVVGYALLIHRRPRVLPLGHSLGVFYSDPTDTSPRRIDTVLYHDANTRLLAFGVESMRDYLWVLRRR